MNEKVKTHLPGNLTGVIVKFKGVKPVGEVQARSDGYVEALTDGQPIGSRGIIAEGIYQAAQKKMLANDEIFIWII